MYRRICPTTTSEALSRLSSTTRNPVPSLRSASISIGPISVRYCWPNSLSFLSILYSDGQDNGPSYSEIGYSVEAGPGSFNISYGEYEDNGDNTLVGYDWNIADFTLGFYYYDYEDDATVAGGADDDGGYVSLSKSF